MSTTLQTLIRKSEWSKLSQLRDDQELADLIFNEHRRRLIVAYCDWMRLGHEQWQRNQLFPKAKPLAEVTPARPWCSAAVLLLTYCDEEAQKMFLMSPVERKDKFVRAILADEGLWAADGSWVEVPE